MASGFMRSLRCPKVDADYEITTVKWQINTNKTCLSTHREQNTVNYVQQQPGFILL